MLSSLICWIMYLCMLSIWNQSVEYVSVKLVTFITRTTCTSMCVFLFSPVKIQFNFQTFCSCSLSITQNSNVMNVICNSVINIVDLKTETITVWAQIASVWSNWIHFRPKLSTAVCLNSTFTVVMRRHWLNYFPPIRKLCQSSEYFAWCWWRIGLICYPKNTIFCQE